MAVHANCRKPKPSDAKNDQAQVATPFDAVRWGASHIVIGRSITRSAQFLPGINIAGPAEPGAEDPSGAEEAASRRHHPHVFRRVDRWRVQETQVHQEDVTCAAGHLHDADAQLVKISLQVTGRP